MQATKPTTVEAYIHGFPAATQILLRQMRKAISETAPAAEEGIGYGIPAYKFKGKPLVYFAGYKNHIGLYATPDGHAAFAEELSKYKQGKGSVQLPLNEALPVALVKKIVRHNLERINGKTGPKNK